MRVCAVCDDACVCVGACGSVYLYARSPRFSKVVYFFTLLAPAAAVSCLDHTAPHLVSSLLLIM